MSDILDHVNKYASVMDHRSKSQARSMLMERLADKHETLRQIKRANDDGSLNEVMKMFEGDIEAINNGLTLLGIGEEAQ